MKFRILLLAISSFFQKRHSLIDENVLNNRVLPNDLDYFRISNDRYISLMNLGQFGIIFRGGCISTFIKKRWFPVVRLATIRYRHPLWLFQKYQLRSQVIYWDTEWIWAEHNFERNNRTIAIGIMKSVMVGPQGIIPVLEFLETVGESLEQPPLPEIIADIMNIEKQIQAKQDLLLTNRPT